MAFSPVTWSFKDLITSTKLAQMVENLRAHDHRVDGSQGDPNLSLGFLATGFNGGTQFPGDIRIVQAPAVTQVATKPRAFRLFASGFGKCQASNLTGHAFEFQRSVNGGAWTSISEIRYKIYPNGSLDDSWTLEYTDRAAPAGSVIYCVRAVGHGINGNALSSSRIDVFDAGPVRT